MRYKHINLVYVKIIVNNQYIERIMMGLEEYLPFFFRKKERKHLTATVAVHFGFLPEDPPSAVGKGNYLCQ